ncbi:glycosyltransferase [Synechococcus sp. PCC 7336]|uniref:glycosyltransferase n=1 Tax=Synechococcus sp. PCC 7336 TaxID=195250 RepID=UPI00034CD46C|nr:glycosyltransferase [Synechococcus sp. PCC 7336]
MARLLVYFLTVNYHCAALIQRLLKSLPDSSNIAHRVAIVNNSPGDRQLEACAGPTVSILTSATNVGFGRACNLGLQWIFARDPQAIVWLVNPDTRLLPGTHLPAVAEFFERYASISILGTIVYTDSQQVWFAGGSFDAAKGAIAEANLISKDSEHPYVECDWVSGCSLLINLARFDRCPQFDPEFFLYYEDFDFCQRYRQQGHGIAITAQFGLSHAPSSITNRNRFNKLHHSTYSYAIALERYADPLARWGRMLRIGLVALALLPLQPATALGKLYGLGRYFRRSAPTTPQ